MTSPGKRIIHYISSAYSLGKTGKVPGAKKVLRASKPKISYLWKEIQVRLLSNIVQRHNKVKNITLVFEQWQQERKVIRKIPLLTRFVRQWKFDRYLKVYKFRNTEESKDRMKYIHLVSELKHQCLIKLLKWYRTCIKSVLTQ